jgi:autotransporter-associated beta strand protein
MWYRNSVWHLAAIAAVACGCWAVAEPAGAQSDPMGYNALQSQLGASMPTGAGIVVEQVEAPPSGTNIHTYMPDTSGGTASPFYGKTLTDATGGGVTSTHATTVGHLFYGVNSGSFAPGITQVDVFEADTWLAGGGLNVGQVGSPPTIPDINNPPNTPPRIINNSWVGTYGTAAPGNQSDLDALRRVDYLAIPFLVSAQGVLVVNAVGNDVRQQEYSLLSGAYNGINVGLTNGQCTYGPTLWGDVPGRCMTDIVVPQSATSWAAPLVSSAAALLLQAAGGSQYPAAASYPATVKAILMAGADKNAVSRWVRTATQPLDLHYGAGQLNIQRAYNILAAGEQAYSNTGGTVNATGWNYASISGGSLQDYFFTVPAGQSYDLSAILTWNRNITGSDLNLALYHANGSSLGALVDQSVSTIDNVEDVFQRVLPNGQYVLQVTRSNSSGSAQQKYTLAWQLQASTVIPAWSGGGAAAGNTWTLGANWGGGTPTAPQLLTFGQLAAGGYPTANNDFAAGTRFGGITFNSAAAAYTLQGNAVSLAGPVTNQSGNDQTIALDVQLTASGGTFNTGTAAITVAGAVSGPGIGLTKLGSGTLTLSGTNNYTGGTTVSDGLLVINNSSALPNDSPLFVGPFGSMVLGDTVPHGLAIVQSGASPAPVAGPAWQAGASAGIHGVPEPGTAALLAAAAACGFALWRRARRRAGSAEE